jgi:PAS domain S-box-containing protein
MYRTEITSESTQRRRRLLVRGFTILAVGGAYYVTAVLSLRLALVEENVTPVWPPTGIALVAILFLGRSVWPGIGVAAFLVNAPISPSLGAAAAIAVGNTLAPLLSAQLLRVVGFRTEFDRLRDALALVFLGALGGMLVSATVGASTLALSGAIPAEEFASAWSVWWTGDAMGVLVVAPFLLSLPSIRLRIGTRWSRRAEATALFVGLAITCRLVFTSDVGLQFLIFPFLIWAAWRFQLRGAAPAALLASAAAIWASVEGTGPFSGGTVLENMVNLQAFNGSVALTAFVLAAITTERLKAREALRRAGLELEERVLRRTEELWAAVKKLELSEMQLAEAQKVAHIGSWEWDVPASTVTWTDELFRLYGLEPGSIKVDDEAFLERLHPDDRERVAAIRDRAFKDHQPFAIDHRIVLPDGSERILHSRGRVVIDEQGNPVKMVGTAQDISERKRAEEYAQRLREADVRRREALELNDEIIQGLALAKYALESGDAPAAVRLVETTLEAVRTIVGDLLGAEGGDAQLEPGDLVREAPARLPEEIEG